MVKNIRTSRSTHDKTRHGFCFFILLLMILLPLSSALAKDVIGTIKNVKGSATVSREGISKPLKATRGMLLFLHDQIKTGPDSRLRLVFKDGSYMTMGEKADLHLDKFEFDPKKQERNAEFRVTIGKFKVFAKDLMKFKKKDFQVKTPTAVIGVRGTVYMVWVVDGNITQVICFQGMLEVANQFAFTGATAVNFGGTAASSFTVDSPNQITAVVGSGSTGKVTVTTPSGTVTSTYDFTFYNSPSTPSFSPTAGGTGTSVTITGDNFTDATAVNFGGTAASSFTVDSPNQITAVVGRG
jgi:hypothetical protein